MSESEAWKDEFLVLLLQQTIGSFRAAISLKDKHAPDVLFKFFGPSEHAFKNLEEGTVFLASPEQFNDPYDSGLTMDPLPALRTIVAQNRSPEPDALEKVGLTLNDFQDLLGGKLSEQAKKVFQTGGAGMSPEDVEKFVAVFPQVAQKLNQKFVDEQLQPFFQRGLKVTCFSERAESLLQWAHYAGQHKGFCVAYGYRDMPDDVPQRRLLFPVLYRQDRFDFGSSLNEFMTAKKDFMPSHAIIAALHKALDWAYEREWRIVNPDGRELGFTIPMVKPRAVYAGLKMAPGDRQRLENICKKLGVQLLTPALSPSAYELVIEQPW